jgi:glutathione S-transferase
VPNPETRQKRRDLLVKGAASAHVGGALAVLDGVFRDIAARSGINGAGWTLADVALLAYVDRVRALGLEGLYQRFPGVDDWLERGRARPSYAEAVTPWQSPAQLADWHSAGTEAWPAIRQQLE